MKKILKIIILTIASLTLTYTLFIIEETFRISHTSDSKPLIVLKEEKNNESVIYNSIGFKLTNRYGYNQVYSEEGEKMIVGQEVWLFDNFLIWGWIS